MEAVRTGLRHIMQDLLRARPAEEAVILAWPLVCGKEVAARTRPASFSNGSLTVEVPDATWRSQLSAFIPRYTAAFNDLLGSVVKQIRFQVCAPGGLPARKQ
jgi:predicted nucleic acid-binding Zn ribbon protein